MLSIVMLKAVMTIVVAPWTGLHYGRKVRVLLQIILRVVNTPTYFDMTSVTNKKSFITLMPVHLYRQLSLVLHSECCYAECCYAECCGTLNRAPLWQVRVLLQIILRVTNTPAYFDMMSVTNKKKFYNFDASMSLSPALISASCWVLLCWMS